MWCFNWCLVYFCVTSVFASPEARHLPPNKYKLLPSEPSQHKRAEQKNINDDEISNHYISRRKAMNPPEKEFVYVNWPNWLPKYNGEYRSIKPEWNKNGDCLFESRKSARPYPNDCYTHTTNTTYSEEAFHAFWQSIRGILSYTFDTVLYSLNDNSKVDFKRTNQFWYLIAYLKQMAIIFQSPDQISAKPGREIFEFGQIDALITDHYASITKISLSTQDRIKLILKLKSQHQQTNSTVQDDKKSARKSNVNTKKPSIKNEKKNESAFEWKKTSLKKAYLLGKKAVVIGQDFDGVPLWVIRAHMEDSDMNIGKFIVNRTFASVPSDGNEVIVKDDFEVLCTKDDSAINWVRYQMGDIWPKNAMLAGEIGLSTKMYVGRIKKNGHYIPGKVINEVLYVPYKGQEYQYDNDFEVLVESQKSDKRSTFKSMKRPEQAFAWKKTCIKHAHNLRDKAVIGGKDHEGVALWVIRAQLENEDLTLGNYNPNRKFASVPKDGHDVLVHDYFDVLCKMRKGALRWMRYKKSEPWPSEAVLGGEMENSTKFYVGRVKHDGLHFPGKVINKVLYIAHQGHEIQYSDKFEVLVTTNSDDKSLRANEIEEHSEPATFTWKKTCLIHAHKLSKKAIVGGQDHNGEPLWIIRVQLDENTIALGKFNPNTTYASVPKDGHEIVVQDNFHVLCEKKKNALDWIEYKMSDPWPENAVVAGEMENSTKIFVGRITLDGLDTPGKIIDKVLYIAYQGEEHQYKDKFEVLVESRDDFKKPVEKSNVKEDNAGTAVLWTRTCPKKAHLLKDLAFVGGKDGDGSPLWVIRAKMEDSDVTLGAFNSNSTYASVPKDGSEVVIQDQFDVLCQKKKNTLKWLNHKKCDPWPTDAVYAHEMENSTKMYVGRVKHEGHYIPGKIIDKKLSIAHEGQEHQYKDNFDILVESYSDTITPNGGEDSQTAVLWTKTCLKKAHLLKDLAVVGGKDHQGIPLWVIRAQVDEDGMSLGIFNSNRSYASVPKDGSEVLVHKDFDVLCQKDNNSLQWVNHKKSDPWPQNAVYASEMENSTKMYVGRVKHDGIYIPGKIINEMLIIAYQGLEYKYDDDFEVLVESIATSEESIHKGNKSDVSEHLVTWKNTKVENSHLLSKEAIVGGEDFGGNPVWIIRSYANNDLSVGKFNPNFTYATVSQNGVEILIDDNFDVLCSASENAVKWVLQNKADSPIPKNAVVAGQKENFKKVFVGRYNMDGHYTPGKIIDKILYIAYQGIEFQYTEGYEILVEDHHTAGEISPTFRESMNVIQTTTKKTLTSSESETAAQEEDADYDDDEYFQVV